MHLVSHSDATVASFVQDKKKKSTIKPERSDVQRLGDSAAEEKQGGALQASECLLPGPRLPKIPPTSSVMKIDMCGCGGTRKNKFVMPSAISNGLSLNRDV